MSMLRVSVCEVPVEVITKDVTLSEYISSKVSLRVKETEEMEDAFYVVDLGRLIKLYDDWKRILPRVQPFYAVKCNEDPALLKTLAALGSGFDCASKAEIRGVLEIGVAPEQIIYANPCKQVSHIKYAARKGVSVMTFDNEQELFKLKDYFPTAKLVLRIRADDPNAICQLGVKFGCDLPVGRELLNTAKRLGLNVIGVSFHVGSGCQTPSAYQDALSMCAEMFEYGRSIGYVFELLDIGGGFPGKKGSEDMFKAVTCGINKSLEEHFGAEKYPNLKIIAEPGRYFACSTHALAVNVFGKRRVEGDMDGYSPSFMYYVNDGVYGSFNCIMFDHVTVEPALLDTSNSTASHFQTSFWGPTCDGLDKICDCYFPELNIGDWVYFDDLGAYTISAASSFNGFQRPKSMYYITDEYIGRFMMHGLLSQATELTPSSSESSESVESVNESTSSGSLDKFVVPSLVQVCS